MKQKLEGYLSKSLNSVNNLFHLKLHNNPLAHQKTLCDYLIFNKHNIIFAVECKQVTCKFGKGAFSFDRLTQKDLLLFFDNFAGNMKSYLCLLFYDDNISNSETYFIPIDVFYSKISELNKKSINRDECKKIFGIYEIFYKKVFDLKFLTDISLI